jgi:hypothetical protein
LTACGGNDEKNTPSNTTPRNSDSSQNEEVKTIPTAPIETALAEPEFDYKEIFYYNEDKFLGGIRIVYYKGVDTEIEIPAMIDGLPVVAVGRLGGYAIDSFCNDARVQEALTNVIFPDGLLEIASYAFKGCKNLVELNLPDSLEHIGEEAFAYCEALTGIIIPDNVTELSEYWRTYSFIDCKSLTQITFGRKSPINSIAALLSASSAPYYPALETVSVYISKEEFEENTSWVYDEVTGKWTGKWKKSLTVNFLSE